MSDASDPHGDRAWLEEQRRRRLGAGREALLGAGAADFGDPGDGEGDDDDDDAGGDDGSGDDRPKRTYRGLRHERLNAAGEIEWTTLGPVADDCPVTPLGRDGKVFFFLTKKGQLVSYEDGKFGQAHLASLFADELMWLMRNFPAFNQGGLLTGFKANLAQWALFASCARNEVFDPREKVRGLGCWRDDEGRLVMHLGNEVRIEGEAKARRPGMIGDHVYPGRPKVPEPVLDGGIEAAEAVLQDFSSWNWSRPQTDPFLLLGWLGCAVLGAALDWRPMIFMTGDAGTGKSTLQERIKKLLPGRLASTVDASPAALRQIVNQDAIGISFDEIEADQNTDQAVSVMKLARVAASGGTVFRGGSDHKAAEFALRGCFAFSAIVPPSMRAQDMQRMAFLRLQPLRKGNDLADFTDGQLKAMGQKLAGRMVQGWPRWREALKVFEAALQSEAYGHNQRGARQFGTLLASAWLMLKDETPTPETAHNWCAGLARADLYEYETSDPTWLRIFRHIMAAQPGVWQTYGYPTVAEVVREYLTKLDKPSEDATLLQRRLNRAGLAVVRERRTGNFFLAVPSKNQQLQAMFRDSDYRAQGGDGAWTHGLRNAPSYRWRPDGPAEGVIRVDKVPQLGREKCTQIWLGALREDGSPIFDLEPDKVAEELDRAV